MPVFDVSIAVINDGFGRLCKEAYYKYQRSLLRKDIQAETVQNRLRKALDEVIDVKELLSDQEIDDVAQRMNAVLSAYAILADLLENDRFEAWQAALREKKVLNQQVEDALQFAKNTAALGKTRKLVVMTEPAHAEGQTKAVEKKLLLDKLKKSWSNGSKSEVSAANIGDLSPEFVEDLIATANTQLLSSHLNSGTTVWNGNGTCEACLRWRETVTNVLAQPGLTPCFLVDGSLVTFVRRVPATSETTSSWEASICLNRDFRAECTCRGQVDA